MTWPAFAAMDQGMADYEPSPAELYQADQNEVGLVPVDDVKYPGSNDVPALGEGSQLGEDDVSLFKSVDGVEVTSLQRSLEKAYMQSSELDSNRAQLRATDEDVAVAVSRWRPSSSVEFRQTQTWQRPSGRQPTGGGGTTGRPNTRNHNTAFALSGRQNVFEGGGTVSRTEAAKERVFAGRFGLTNTEQTVLVNTVQAYLDVITNEAIADLRKSSEAFLNKTWEQTRVRYEVGEVTRTEVEAAKSSYLGAVAERLAADAAVETARATYNRVVGSPAGNLGKAEILVDLPDSLNEARDQAVLNNPRVHQAAHNIEAAEYDVNTQISGLLPSIDLDASISRSEFGGSGKQTRVGNNRQTDARFETVVSMPLYSQGSTRAQIRQAHQKVAQAKVDLVTAKRTSVEDATRAWEDLQSARSQVESLIAQVQSSKLAVEGVSEEASVGTKNVLDVLEQEENLVNAQIRLVQAERSLVLASYQVLVAVGRMTAQDLKLDVDLYEPEDYYDQHSGAFFKFWKGKDYRYVKDQDENDDYSG